MLDFERVLKALEYGFTVDRIDPSVTLIEKYELSKNIALPEDYKSFLERYSRTHVSAAVPLLHAPTPFETDPELGTFIGFEAEAESAIDFRSRNRFISETFPIITIADNLFDDRFYLCVAGSGKGSVYFHDLEQRHRWSDEEFFEYSEAVGENVQEWLRLRRQNQLPYKVNGFYLVAKSFSDFLLKCRLRLDEE